MIMTNCNVMLKVASIFYSIHHFVRISEVYCNQAQEVAGYRDMWRDYIIYNKKTTNICDTQITDMSCLGVEFLSNCPFINYQDFSWVQSYFFCKCVTYVLSYGIFYNSGTSIISAKLHLSFSLMIN